ncbi:MAG: hypothetical protein ACYDHW_10875 [Syntrophorhabdaceae bacterium]
MILALDCATKTGWALIKSGEVYESGVQDFSKKRGESNGAMFLKFRQWLKQMMIMSDPGLVVYEQAHHRGGAATEVCVNLTGRVQEICAASSFEYATIETRTLKKWATGKGTADKQAMIEAAKAKTGLLPKDDNEADAILLGLMAYEEYGV